MIVYLDTAVLYEMLDEPDILERLNALAKEGVKYVFTMAHLMDISGVENASDVIAVVSKLARLEGSEWRLGGLELGALEIARLKNGLANDRVHTLPSPTHSLEVSWNEYYLRVQEDPNAVMSDLVAMRKTMGAGQASRNLSRGARGQIAGAEKTKVQKEILKYMQGRGSERDIHFARSRRKHDQVVSQAMLLGEAITFAEFTLRIFRDCLLPQLATTPNRREYPKGEIHDALRELADLIQRGESLASDAGGIVLQKAQMVDDLLSKSAKLTRAIGLFGVPSDAASTAEEQQLYTEFDNCYGMAVALRYTDACDETARRELFGAWQASAMSSCSGGYLLSRVRVRRYHRLDTEEMDSDYADLVHLSCLPYVDVLFADKRTVELMRTMRDEFSEYLPRLKKNGEFYTWLQGVEQEMWSSSK